MFKKFLPEWLFTFISLLLTFASGRLFLFSRYTNSALRQQYQTDLGALFSKGFLFDIKSASLTLAVLVLPAIILLAYQKGLAAYYRLHRRFATAMILLAIALTVGNIFYYSVYNRPFDVFIFGLLDEDTTAVLKTIWSDYPIVSALIGLAITALPIAFLLTKLHNHVQNKPVSGSLKTQIAYAFGMVLLLVIGIRASFGTFPLRKSSAQVSPSETLNKLVPNPITALGWAVAEYRNSNQYNEVSDEDGSRLFSTMLGKPVAKPTLDNLQVTTPNNPEAAAKRPNVVLAVMESMSSHLWLQLDDPKTRDLLGELRPHFAQDWLYKRFVSEGNGTSDTLHRFFIRSPLNNVSQTSAKNKTFPTNVFKPYLNAGYTVVYLTAGNGGWRDFDTFTKHLGAQEFVDETELRRRYPEAQSGTWGVPDEYMFSYATERLQQADKEHKPVFIMMMSITNHPPYALPNTSKRVQYPLSEAEKAQFSSLGDAKELNEILNTYHYANNALGHFITQAKQTNTIIAATGDHNMRGIAYPNISDLVLAHAVPFYLYAPENYRQNTVYQPERIGSHKDIMPTLYELSLPKQTYLRTGCNLTQPENADNPWCGYGYNAEIAFYSSGVMNLSTKAFYPWEKDGNLLQVSAQSAAVPEADKIVAQRGQTYGDFLNWLLNRMVTQPENAKK
ncbi:LTA synthase family protein [Kingella negevensis]|uniref:LTA synthase family protein n=1 Tax=Kingella negevensis TaxID=1522312 RepID=UPI002550DC54|nr:alkaline phosphatase family protein [Kingella negevensis]MDK4681313.1 sulfatase-like hydrolase/transferase [Kingella negevensis]MDK4683510.1 sulfatase-like hydrolase/transferase [Kingella negevensis]MDK4691355.1 sulfatase-like hydrolase/transferase [Kingella negevensis]MDK4693496.1 sulfatase-like hydrolase/transferase [Kingella negevensis]MDK4700109.1 sulfatase-like hydrolase/transferase [Kingella negevensis]